MTDTCLHCHQKLDEDLVCPHCHNGRCQSCKRLISEDRIGEGWNICEACEQRINKEDWERQMKSLRRRYELWDESEERRERQMEESNRKMVDRYLQERGSNAEIKGVM